MWSLQSAACGHGGARARFAFGARYAPVVISLLAAAVSQAGNLPPVISGTPASSVLATHFYLFQPSARDPNGDHLRFSISNKPSWAGFDSSTGKLWGRPTQAESGTYKNVTISVSDGKTSSTLRPFNLQVIGMIVRPPTLAGSPPSSVTVGQAYSFQPAARDPQGDRLTFSLLNKPAWLSINTTTGAIAGVPNSTGVGTYRNVVLTASNGSASAHLPAFSITVRAPAAAAAVEASSTVTLDWVPPTENTDFSALTDLAGYRIYYGAKPTSLNQRIQVANPGLTRYVVDNLNTGTWYFALTAYNRAGRESALSGIIATDTR
jgi:Putative Ig domain